MIEFKLAFLVLYYAAGVLVAVLAFVSVDAGYRSVSLVGAPTIGFIFGAALVWPLIVLAAAAMAGRANCRRTYGS
jgi:hypothetical protein